MIFMKIAHIVSTFPPIIGGMGQVCLEEIKLLAERGHNITAFTLLYKNRHSESSLFDKNFAAGISTRRLKPFFKIGDAGWTPKLFFKLNGFDIAHLHYPFYGGAQCVFLAKIFNGQKYVLTYHMDASPSGLIKKILQAIYDAVWAKRILLGAEKIITVDKEYFLQTKYAGAIDKNKVVEIPNGVDAEVFCPRAVDLAKIGLEKFANKKIILFVGNAMPIKRLDLLIDAYKSLSDGDAVLTIVGGGYKIKKYKKMAENLGLAEKIIFAGLCSDKNKLSEYYNAARCLVVPSESESFSLAAVEAMACGCPVVGSDAPGIRGRIDNGIDGFLFKSGSAEGLADKLRKVLSLSEEERKKMGEAGRKKAMEKYGWKKHVDELEKIYFLYK